MWSISSDLSIATWSLVRGSKGITPVQSFYNNTIIRHAVTDVSLHPMSGEVVVVTIK